MISSLKNKNSASIVIDFQAQDYYMNEKYNFMGKKDMNKEEYEDSLLKFLIERKNISLLIDPFDIHDSLGYQRFH